MKKRIISALLLASMALTLVACDGDTDNPADTSNDALIDEEAPAGIEKQNYDGDFNILIAQWGLYRKYFDPGDDLTDIMNKALYNREIKVEEHLGVDITYEYIESTAQTFETLDMCVPTNDDRYQMALTHCIYDTAQLITEGYVLDMNRLGIDFSADWFKQSCNEAISVNDKQFFAVSDYMLPDPNVVLFNKTMLEENKLEDPYQLVRDGKWTLDKMTEMAHVATRDNGDTTRDENDIYGFAAPNDWFLNSFIFAADVDIVNKDENGDFQLAFDNERAYTLFDKLHTLLNGPDTWVFQFGGLIDEDVEGAIPLSSGRWLFTLFALNSLYEVRDVEVEFGILPYPKLDEKQTDYISNDWTGLFCVPLSVPEENYEMVGDVIELLSYFSEDVIPTYVDITLGEKLARDEESKEMLQIVFNGTTFDPAMNYFGFNGAMENIFFSPDRMLVVTGRNNLASWIARYGTKAQTILDDFNDAVKDIEG